MKKNILIGIFLVVFFIVAFFLSNLNTKEEKKEELLSGKKYVEISVKDYGKISLELDADTAPITVTNFMKLVNNKFYDGLTFHRIIKGFMVQGGDPEGTGYGGSDETIKGEFSQNGVENNISHERGVISMARGSGDMNSASSQFFIVQEDATYLDGNYAAFGYVTQGMDVVDKLAEVKVEDENGTVAKENQPVIEYIKEVKNENYAEEEK